MSADASTRRGEATRRRLIRASERLFADEGIEAVSVRRINTAAVSDLLEQLGEGVFSELLGQVRRASPATDLEVLARRWQIAAEALIHMLGEAGSQEFGELLGFVAAGVEAQLRPPTPHPR